MRLFNTNIDFIFKRTLLLRNWIVKLMKVAFLQLKKLMRRFLAKAEPPSDKIVRPHLYGLRLINYRAVYSPIKGVTHSAAGERLGRKPTFLPFIPHGRGSTTKKGAHNQ